MSKLRYAPLIRVSTERQEKQGESLNTQRKQIIQYVESLGGTITKRCWKYSGQEHATIGQERKNLDQLLTDSGKGLFDAVIVCDASRWSRDNLKSKQGFRDLSYYSDLPIPTYAFLILSPRNTHIRLRIGKKHDV